MEESFEVPTTSLGTNLPPFTLKLLPSLPKHWAQVGPNWYWHLDFSVPTTCEGKFQCTHYFRYANTGSPHSQLAPACSPHSSSLPACSSSLPACSSLLPSPSSLQLAPMSQLTPAHSQLTPARSISQLARACPQLAPACCQWPCMCWGPHHLWGVRGYGAR